MFSVLQKPYYTTNNLNCDAKFRFRHDYAAVVGWFADDAMVAFLFSTAGRSANTVSVKVLYDIMQTF